MSIGSYTKPRSVSVIFVCPVKRKTARAMLRNAAITWDIMLIISIQFSVLQDGFG